MKISYYTGEHPNFGDDLNLWMWPRLLPNFFDDDERAVFLGIGSIIGEKQYKHEIKKIIFGAGFVPEYHDKPDIKGPNWKIYFVRGPRTANLLDISPDLALGDPALLLRTFVDLSQKTSEVISFIPHWESMDRGNWEEVCSLAGINLIDPRRPVEEVLENLLKSKLVITEALHGAIVADSFRIPWVPALPLNAVHRNKWGDWASALNIHLRWHRLCPSSLLEARLSFLRKPVMALPCTDLIEKGLIHLSAERLIKLAGASPCLSDDAAIERVTARMVEKVEQLRHDYDDGIWSEFREPGRIRQSRAS